MRGQRPRVNKRVSDVCPENVHDVLGFEGPFVQREDELMISRKFVESFAERRFRVINPVKPHSPAAADES
jgi:hypothetical protein